MKDYNHGRHSLGLTFRFVINECGECNTVYGVPVVLWDRLRENGGHWYCVGCGSHRVFRTSRVEELELQVKRAEGRADMYRTDAEHQERRARSIKGHLTRTKKRVSAGVCPCCNRTFKQLAAHMRRQHPKYTEEKVA